MEEPKSLSMRLEEYSPRLKGIRLIVGEWQHSRFFSSNVYSIGDSSITLVDAGEESETDNLANALQKLNLNVKNVNSVVVTHSHDDHWGGLKKLLQVVNLNVMVYKGDLTYYQEELGSLKGVGSYRIVGLDDGDIVEAEGHRLTALHTPGHDDGSICLYDKDYKILFSGDTVFASGTTGSMRSGSLNGLRSSLRRLAVMDIDIMLPGHGYIAYEKADEAIRLALERITWKENSSNDILNWIRQGQQGRK